MHSTTARLAVISSAVAATLLSGLITTSGAHADDTVCATVAQSLAGCGGVTNLSGTAVVAYKSWCDGNNGPCGNSHQRRLTRGQVTPWFEDWDAVWVPCRAVGYKTVGGGAVQYPWTGGAGRPGGVGAHKIRDPEHLVITGVFC
ncbi:hypothetical protein [Nonomuraea sp. C10]|uniref:hypothetical protein n=1 Tax=Nonomuraea sp. C10 TaxID=2600577 RepID=UPI0011CDBE39|nr:hypothetical protein [Nonomuraea sp. C10]TXK41266.1 hypothetical protein FR742_18345 [Nonomuraea sp. C10]